MFPSQIFKQSGRTLHPHKGIQEMKSVFLADMAKHKCRNKGGPTSVGIVLKLLLVTTISNYNLTPTSQAGSTNHFNSLQIQNLLIKEVIHLT